MKGVYVCVYLCIERLFTSAGQPLPLKCEIIIFYLFKVISTPSVGLEHNPKIKVTCSTD